MQLLFCVCVCFILKQCVLTRRKLFGFGTPLEPQVELFFSLRGNMRGFIIGDSQLKSLCADRLYLSSNVTTCAFSFPGATVAFLTRKVDTLQFSTVDFVAIYVGRNDQQGGMRSSGCVGDVVAS